MMVPAEVVEVVLLGIPFWVGDGSALSLVHHSRASPRALIASTFSRGVSTVSVPLVRTLIEGDNQLVAIPWNPIQD